MNIKKILIICLTLILNISLILFGCQSSKNCDQNKETQQAGPNCVKVNSTPINNNLNNNLKNNKAMTLQEYMNANRAKSCDGNVKQNNIVKEPLHRLKINPELQKSQNRLRIDPDKVKLLNEKVKDNENKNDNK
jgi:hypothetical protein